MRLRRLTLDELKNLYDTQLREAFPPEELKPYAAMERLYLDGCYEPYVTEDEAGTLLGYALLWGEKNGRYVLLDYLGVAAERRNGGIGAIMLTLLQERFQEIDGIIGEVEAAEEGDDGEENTLRSRRLGFYLRNGCRFMEYDCDLFGVHFRTMLFPTNGKDNDVAAMKFHQRIYQAHLRPELYRRFVEIPRREDRGSRPLIPWADLETL